MLQSLAIKSFDDVLGYMIFGCCCGLPLLVVFGLYIRTQRLDRRLKRVLAKVTDEEKAEVLRLAKEAVSEEGANFCLTLTEESTGDDSTLIRLPNNIPNYPWGGRCVTVERASDVDYVWSFVESDFRGVAIRGHIYRLEENIFEIRDLSYYPELKAFLTRLYAESPGALLKEILPKRYPVGKISGHPSWLQEPEFPRCDICGKDMVLIMELDEEVLVKKGGDTCYFFGCQDHPDSTASGSQGT